jgi:uncharacterized protein YhhL (DUF1145 family)
MICLGQGVRPMVTTGMIGVMAIAPGAAMVTIIVAIMEIMMVIMTGVEVVVVTSIVVRVVTTVRANASLAATEKVLPI